MVTQVQCLYAVQAADQCYVAGVAAVERKIKLPLRGEGDGWEPEEIVELLRARQF